METEGSRVDVRKRFEKLYGQLCEVAAAMLARRPHSLAPTELVHEAFVGLQQEEQRRQQRERSQLGAKPDSVFKACFGAACRDALNDRHRRRRAKKRGGDVVHEPPRSSIQFAGQDPADAVLVEDALSALAGYDALMAQIVEARLFGGLSVAECAALFDVSQSTVDRNWRFGKAWLRERML